MNGQSDCRRKITIPVLTYMLDPKFRSAQAFMTLRRPVATLRRLQSVLGKTESQSTVDCQEIAFAIAVLCVVTQYASSSSQSRAKNKKLDDGLAAKKMVPLMK